MEAIYGKRSTITSCVISHLEWESPKYQLAIFKHVIGDSDGLKVIKTFNYTEEDVNNWHEVMGKMEKYCIGEVNKIYERYCFNKRDKLLAKMVDNFVAELKTLAKTCNFSNCLRNILICNQIVLGVKMSKPHRLFLR